MNLLRLKLLITIFFVSLMGFIPIFNTNIGFCNQKISLNISFGYSSNYGQAYAIGALDGDVAVNGGNGAVNPNRPPPSAEAEEAASKSDNIKKMFENFKLASKIKSALNKILEPFKTLYNSMLNTSQEKSLTMMKMLFYMVTLYEIAKKYLESDYKSLVPTIVFECFKYSALYTFISGQYYFLIPEEIIGVLTGTGSFSTSLASSSPTEIATDIIAKIFSTWDSTVTKDLTAVYDAYNTARTSTTGTMTGGLNAMPQFFELIFGFLIATIGYIILSVACLGVVIKSIEFTIAIPISVFLICLRVARITHEYHNIGMGYVVAAVIDFSILKIVANLAEDMLKNVGSAGLIDLLKGLFACIISALLIKVAPKIGSGIVSGRPSISMSDASGIFSQVALAAAAGATIMKSVAMPTSAVVGSAIGAADAIKAGGGAMDALKGAAKGGSAGAKAANSVIGGQGIGSAATKSLSG